MNKTNKKIKTYTADWLGKKQRERVEKKLFEQEYEVESEEELKQWDGGQACCLGIIFLPLMLIAKKKKIRVTYVKK